MYTTKLDYKFQKFNEENVEALLKNLNLNPNNFFAMEKPGMLSMAFIGNLANFFVQRYCIFCFSETEIKLIMLSRLDNKQVTETITIHRNELNKIKISKILFIDRLCIKLCNSGTMKFQVFKKFFNFKPTSDAIEVFKTIYQ